MLRENQPSTHPRRRTGRGHEF